MSFIDYSEAPYESLLFIITLTKNMILWIPYKC